MARWKCKGESRVSQRARKLWTRRRDLELAGFERIRPTGSQQPSGQGVREK